MNNYKTNDTEDEKLAEKLESKSVEKSKKIIQPSAEFLKEIKAKPKTTDKKVISVRTPQMPVDDTVSDGGPSEQKKEAVGKQYILESIKEPSLYENNIKSRLIIILPGAAVALVMLFVGVGYLRGFSDKEKVDSTHLVPIEQSTVEINKINLTADAFEAKGATEKELDSAVAKLESRSELVVYDSGNISACYHAYDKNTEQKVLAEIYKTIDEDSFDTKEEFEEYIVNEAAEYDAQVAATCVMSRDIYFVSDEQKLSDEIAPLTLELAELGYSRVDDDIAPFSVQQNTIVKKKVDGEDTTMLVTLPRTKKLYAGGFSSEKDYFPVYGIPTEIDTQHLVPEGSGKILFALKLQDIYFSKEATTKLWEGVIDENMLNVSSEWGEDRGRVYDEIDWTLYKPTFVDNNEVNLRIGDDAASLVIQYRTSVDGITPIIKVTEFEFGDLAKRFVAPPNKCNYVQAEELVTTQTNTVVRVRACKEKTQTASGVKIYSNSDNELDKQTLNFFATINDTAFLYSFDPGINNKDRVDAFANEFVNFLDSLQIVDKADYYNPF